MNCQSLYLLNLGMWGVQSSHCKNPVLHEMTMFHSFSLAKFHYFKIFCLFQICSFLFFQIQTTVLFIKFGCCIWDQWYISQFTCRVLALASCVELHRDMYCKKPEKELSHVGQISDGNSDTDWIEPFLFPCNPKTLQDNGSDRVYNAILLLQTDPSVQVQSMLYDSISVKIVCKR